MKPLAKKGKNSPVSPSKTPSFYRALSINLYRRQKLTLFAFVLGEFLPIRAILFPLRYTGPMAAPFVPSPLDCIGRKRFAFYPPIQGLSPNEWLLGAGSRSEVQAVNAQTGIEIWISRQYIGAVSDHSHFLTVGLRKTLEFRDGQIQPRVKSVIEMPQASGDRFQMRREQGPAAVVAIRLEEESGKKSTALKTIVVGVAIASLVAALFAAWHSSSVLHF